jgi:hypothetical protein
MISRKDDFFARRDSTSNVRELIEAIGNTAEVGGTETNFTFPV